MTSGIRSYWLRLSEYHTVIKYFLIGCTAALVDVGVYGVLFNVIKWPAVLSTTISVSVATIYAFFLNAFVNFKKTDRLGARFVSYALVSGVGLLLSALILFVFTQLLGLNGNVIKLLSLPVIFVVQYWLNKYFTFRPAVETEQSSLL